MKHYIQKDLDLILKNTEKLKYFFEGKKILLTGGNGFLGKYFIAYFEKLNLTLSKPITLTVFDITYNKNLNKKNFTLIKKDVSKTFETNKKFDIIIHAAGIASPFYYRKKPIEAIEVTIQGIKNCLYIAKKNNSKLIFFSSSEIYGDPQNEFIPTNEKYRGNVSSMGPRACYDESKRLGETFCYIYSKYFNVHTNIIRPFNVYGPGMKQNDYRIFPNFIGSLLSSKTLQIYGSGKQTRTYCYITDAIEGFLRVICLGKSGEAYNIGNNYPEVSITDVIKILKKINNTLQFKKTDYPESYPDDEPQRRCPDLTKAMLHLKYKPKVSLEKGLKLFYSWAKNNYKY